MAKFISISFEMTELKEVGRIWVCYPNDPMGNRVNDPKNVS